MDTWADFQEQNQEPEVVSELRQGTSWIHTSKRSEAGSHRLTID